MNGSKNYSVARTRKRICQDLNYFADDQRDRGLIWPIDAATQANLCPFGAFFNEITPVPSLDHTAIPDSSDSTASEMSESYRFVY
jgi:hypothetical protein